MTSEQHNSTIVEQFTKQAIPFTEVPGHLDAIEMLIQLSGVDQEDNVLDVACGSGLVLCEFAKIANTAEGIDITEEMLIQAAIRQEKLNLNNIQWQLGDVTRLPYEDNSFSVIITRYSFHHLLNPKQVFSEMYRVCKPGGKILVADVVLPKDKADRFNEMEKLRDNSHTQALTFEEMENIFHQHHMKDITRSGYHVDMELEQQLMASFPEEGAADKIRDIFREDLEKDNLGVGTRLVDWKMHFSYPISVYVGTK